MASGGFVFSPVAMNIDRVPCYTESNWEKRLSLATLSFESTHLYIYEATMIFY
jgi:hypothetical protein